MKSMAMAAAIVAAVAVLATPATVRAADVSFKDKTITMIIPTTAGGGTDVSARLFAKFFGDTLPGNPAVVPRNMPGAHGITALNHTVQQAKPDGLTVTMSSNSQVDPAIFRLPQAKYVPNEFQIIGGLGLGDTVMIIRTDALRRLLDKSKSPVVMGAIAGVPRPVMRMTVWGAEYLGWNSKWVVGYPGTTDLMLALERGEVEMTSLSKHEITGRLSDAKTFKLIYQKLENENAKGTERAEGSDIPLFTKAMEGKISDPKIKAAYDYWRASTPFKWLALPPKTPDDIRDTYRDAFRKIVVNPEFLKLAGQAMQGFTIISPEDTVKMIADLAATSDEALGAMDELMRKHGLNTDRSN